VQEIPTVDQETWKAIVSGVSALVAVWGAIATHRSRNAAARDAFDASRDQFLVFIRENEQRAGFLAFQSGLFRDEIQSLLERHPQERSGDVQDRLTGLTRLETARTILSGRDYSDESVLALQFTRANVAGLRELARNERMLASVLKNDGYDAVFERARSLLTRLRAKGAA
jgi:hypothetical protein